MIDSVGECVPVFHEEGFQSPEPSRCLTMTGCGNMSLCFPRYIVQYDKALICG